MLDHLVGPLGGETTLLGDDLAEDEVDFTGHVGGITADVEVGLLLEEAAHQVGVLTQTVLDVHLLGGFTGEGSNDLELVSKLLLVSL